MREVTNERFRSTRAEKTYPVPVVVNSDESNPIANVPVILVAARNVSEGSLPASLG